LGVSLSLQGHISFKISTKKHIIKSQIPFSSVTKVYWKIENHIKLSLEETPLVSKSLNSIYKSCIYWDNNNQAKNTQSSIPENPEPSKLIPQDRIKRFNKNPKGNTIPEYIEDETHACNSSPLKDHYQ
jgi:hypothetical protein